MADLDKLRLETRVAEILHRRPAVGLAVGVVRDGALQFSSAHGVADIPSRAPVTEDTVFRIGSITKTITAIAAMQLVERGLIDLDAPANDYLRAYRLVPRKREWRPATVRHLLTHTAGIAEEVPRTAAVRRDYGVGFPPGRVPTPAEYYRGRVRLDVEPGTRFRYTDHGPTAVGQIVEDVSGLPLDRYLRERVFAPLGMADTDLVLPDRLRPRLATGYRLRGTGPRAVPRRDSVTAAAGNTYSTPRDMARYLVALPAAAPTSTAACSSPRRWPRCSRRSISRTRGSPGWGWRSGASTAAGTASSSTRARCPASTRRSSSPRTTASG